MRQHLLLAILPPAHKDFWTVTPKLRLPDPSAALVADGLALVSVAPKERREEEKGRTGVSSVWSPTLILGLRLQV